MKLQNSTERPRSRECNLSQAYRLAWLEKQQGGRTLLSQVRVSLYTTPDKHGLQLASVYQVFLQKLLTCPVSAKKKYWVSVTSTYRQIFLCATKSQKNNMKTLLIMKAQPVA